MLEQLKSMLDTKEWYAIIMASLYIAISKQDYTSSSFKNPKPDKNMNEFFYVLLRLG
jgi:hypothetical protein